MQRNKKGGMNSVAFCAVSSSSPYGYLCPKLKTQKSKHRSGIDWILSFFKCAVGFTNLSVFRNSATHNTRIMPIVQ